MTDIFISYSSKDREWVRPLADALQQQGYRVWWDTGLLSGDDFHKTIPEKLDAASCVIVVWTPNSVESLWVKAEASRGLRRNVLIPILAGDTEIPIPFDMIHSDNFREWSAGDVNADEFKRLLLAVSRYTEPSILLEQAEHEAKLEAERRRKEQEEAAKRQQAEEEQRRREAEAEELRKKEETAAEEKRRQEVKRERKAEEERQRQAVLEEERKAVEAAEAEKRKAEQARKEQEERAKAEQARREAAKAAQQPAPDSQNVAVSDVPDSSTSTTNKAGIGTGAKIGGGVAVVGIAAALIYLGAKPSPEPAYLSEPVASSTPDASGFQAVADPSQMGKVGFAEPEMVRIEGGSFKMGCVSGQSCRDNEKPVHTVNVPSFEMGKYEVTFEEWDACVADGGCKHKLDDRGWGLGKRPVINVSWNDVQDEYIPWLNKKTGKRFRLPTEAEWEYAARAGTNTAYPWGNDASHDYANYGTDDCCDGLAKGKDKWINIAPVGQFAAYGGLHDMNGNAYEWVQDCYHDSYKGAPTNNSAWESSCEKVNGEVIRVLRGGSWGSGLGSLRSAYRHRSLPAKRYVAIGFRLARTL